MSEKISRRDFLKLAGAGGAAAALTGCGPASRYVRREPYTDMPEYTHPGKSTYFATTCFECAAGCGLLVRTFQGRAIKVEGNPYHPVSGGKTCARGQATVEGLYNPDRVPGPVRVARGAANDPVSWDQAIDVVAGALSKYQPDEVAFLLGMAPDHLFDLVAELAAAGGARPPLRFGALGMFEARATLIKATEQLFGQAAMPFFDMANADVVFSFGANYLETWISPVAQARAFSSMRRGKPGRRGYIVHFEPRMSQTASVADEWVPIAPGTEGLVAAALGIMVAEAREQQIPPAYAQLNLDDLLQQADVDEEVLRRLARIFAEAREPLAIPGGSALGQVNGVENARAVLALNAVVENLGRAGGMFLSQQAPVKDDAYHRPHSLYEIDQLIKAMRAGEIKALFIHGVNPVFELPAALGFAQALEKVELVVSFATFPDETAQLADYIFPDHAALESWGYQKVVGVGPAVVSGAQPVVLPVFDTRATADVLLAAVQKLGGSLAEALPYADEVTFIRQAVAGLRRAADGYYAAADEPTFFSRFQQFGGWWTKTQAASPPPQNGLDKPLVLGQPEFEGEGELILLPYPSPILGDGAGANRPWLQETPDPMTTVMWNTWVEINPETARELGVTDDDVIRVKTPYGVLEASVYRYPAIRPDVIAIPFGQGHTALGRYAEGRGANPARIMGVKANRAGDLAFAAMRVQVEKTGRQRSLARAENRVGVYGDGE